MSARIGLPSLLGIVFIVLKLLGVITWSWWVVLLPFYGPLVIVLVVLAIWGLVSFAKAYSDVNKSVKNGKR